MCEFTTSLLLLRPMCEFKPHPSAGYDHGIGDATFRNSTLAANLQEKYLKHFELVAEQRWSVLLDYMADQVHVRKVIITC